MASPTSAQALRTHAALLVEQAQRLEQDEEEGEVWTVAVAEIRPYGHLILMESPRGLSLNDTARTRVSPELPRFCDLASTRSLLLAPRISASARLFWAISA